MAKRRNNLFSKETTSLPGTTKQSSRKVKEFNDKTVIGDANLQLKYSAILLVPIVTVFVITFFTDGVQEMVVQYASIVFGNADDSIPSCEQFASNAGQPSTVCDIQEESITEEIKNYKPLWQKTISVKQVSVNGNRIIPVQLIPRNEADSSVRLYLLDKFLSDRECSGLMKAHDRHVQEWTEPPLLCFDSLDTLKSHLREVGASPHVTSDVFSPGTLCLNASLSRQIQKRMNSNWSYSTAFYPEESEFSTVLALRIEEAMGLDPGTGGKFQITSYPVGKAYKAHTDCSIGGTDPRDRAFSVIIYLNDVTDGGETEFPGLGIGVTPKKGRALVWNNMSPKGYCEPDSQHVASVVRSGSKYILIRWYYYKSFYSIGKRMPGPLLPPRGPDVPMVRCDFYTHGSCRWYDEWSPLVMTEYARRYSDVTDE